MTLRCVSSQQDLTTFLNVTLNLYFIEKQLNSETLKINKRLVSYWTVMSLIYSEIMNQMLSFLRVRRNVKNYGFIKEKRKTSQKVECYWYNPFILKNTEKRYCLIFNFLHTKYIVGNILQRNDYVQVFLTFSNEIKRGRTLNWVRSESTTPTPRSFSTYLLLLFLCISFITVPITQFSFTSRSEVTLFNYTVII